MTKAVSQPTNQPNKKTPVDYVIINNNLILYYLLKETNITAVFQSFFHVNKFCENL